MELELEAQLQEYATALQGIDEALKTEPSVELTEVRESLLAAVAELEGALLEIKRSRLLSSLSEVGEPAAPPPLEPLVPIVPSADTSVDGCGAVQEGDAGPALLGTQCRFRYSDGRWYCGVVSSVEEHSGMASVSFNAPTRSYMLSGARVQLSSLRPPKGQTRLGATVHAGAAISTEQGGGTANIQGGEFRRSHIELEVGDRVFVRPRVEHQQSQQQLKQQRQQVGGGLWQAASVVSVSGATSEATVIYEQGGARGHVSFSDMVCEAWDGCSDLASDAAEDGEDDDGSSSSSTSNTDIDVYDGKEEGDGGGCQGRGAPGAELAGGLGYGRHRRKRVRLGEDGEGKSVLDHVREAAEAGAATDTKHFAQWEKHGRGIASRLMAKNGYKEGSGLGRQRSGIIDPVQVLVLPKGQGLGLGSAGRSLGEDGGGTSAADGGPLKRKRRGGERRRKAKHAAAGREARDARHSTADAQDVRGAAPGLFGFLNQALGDNSSTAAKLRDHQQSMFKHYTSDHVTGSSVFQEKQHKEESGGTGKGAKAAAAAAAAGASDARARLMRQQGKVEHCHARVAHFQEMLQRNRANPSLAAQISQRLKDVQAELAAEVAEQAHMSKSITGKDNQKRMLKF